MIKFPVVKRGEIYFADMGEGIGSEQKGERPVLIIQNDVGNRHSPTTIVALITSVGKKSNLPVHLNISKEQSSLAKDSTILFEQVRTIDKQRLLSKVSILNDTILTEIDKKIILSLGISTS